MLLPLAANASYREDPKWPCLRSQIYRRFRNRDIIQNTMSHIIYVDR
jgi:hypothetical protein